MSAIYGAINLDGKEIDTSIINRFQEEYKECKIDRHESKTIKEAVMGCELQYFNQFARNEVLPIIDEEHSTFFTADCVLDFRDKLMSELGINGDNLADGSLIYRSYLKWGKECINHLRGNFSFVIYNWKTKEVYLQTDHFSGRSLFYWKIDNTLYFSTMFFPMVKAVNAKYDLNERWIVDSISLIGPTIYSEPWESAIKGIYKVAPGHYVYFKKGEENRIQYWNPAKNIKINKKITDKECEDTVRRIMTESVEQMIITDGEVASQLSSGLDSSTVACIAAPLLDKQGKKLYSFTSVPLKEAQLPDNGYLRYDETDGVNIICSRYPNIMPSFINSEGKNILTNADEIISEWQVPCKSQQNAIWVSDIDNEAAKKGCKILLTGGSGNCTLSAGKIECLLRYYFSRGRFITGLKKIRNYMHKYRGNTKAFVKEYIRLSINYYLWYFQKEKKDMYANIFTRKDIGEKYSVNARFRKKFAHYKPAESEKQIKENVFFVVYYAQVSEIETNFSLANGILHRDPMKNVELIEFLSTLPLAFFVNENFDRRLVREFMHDIVPDEIRLDVAHRGRQSGDNVFRIDKVLEDKYDEVKSSLLSKENLQFLDEGKMIKALEDIINNGYTIKKHENLIDAYMFSKYLELL